MDNPKNPVVTNSIKLYPIARLNNKDLTISLIITIGHISMGADIKIFSDFLNEIYKIQKINLTLIS